MNKGEQTKNDSKYIAQYSSQQTTKTLQVNVLQNIYYRLSGTGVLSNSAMHNIG